MKCIYKKNYYLARIFIFSYVCVCVCYYVNMCVYLHMCSMLFVLFYSRYICIYLYSQSVTLHERCPYSELFCSAFSRILTKYGEILRISPYFMQC